MLTISVLEDDGVLLDLRPDERVIDVPDGVVRVGPHQPQGTPRRVHYPRLVHLAQRRVTLEELWGRHHILRARWTTKHDIRRFVSEKRQKSLPEYGKMFGEWVGSLFWDKTTKTED